MKKICLLVLLAALRCAGQTEFRHLLAWQVMITAPNRDAGGSHPPDLSALTVSAAHLRHKIPKEALSAFAKGQKLSLAGKPEPAAREFEKAVTRDPGFAEAYGALGAAYAKLDRFSDAEREMSRAIALDPSPTTYYNLGLMYYQTGDLKAAEKAVRTALKFPQSEPTTHLLMAYILLPDAAKREEAERHLRLAARTIPQAGYLLQKMEQDNDDTPARG